MARLGFYLNMNTCLGCGACAVACKDAHGLPAGEFFRRAAVVEGDGRYFTYSGACNHCNEPRCVAACPTGAMHKAEDGTVIHDDGMCIGCGACVWNCPYGAVSLSGKKGIAQKCDACASRRAEGKAPVCVGACPTQSLRFGDLDALMAETGGTAEELAFLPKRALSDPSLAVKLPRGKKGDGK